MPYHHPMQQKANAAVRSSPLEGLQVGGAALEAVAISGDPARATLVFLHEGLGSVAMWKGRQGDWPQQVCEATGHPGLVYSRRGYGHSSAIADVRGQGRLGADYMHREAWEVLPGLLERLGIRQPLLIGHSDGGSIALLHASRHVVAGCIVLAPHVMVEDVSLRSIHAAREAYLHSGLRDRLARFHADVDSAFWQWNDVWLSESFRSFDIREDCRRIRAPVLAIQGLDDTFGTLRQIEEIAPVQGHFEMFTPAACGHSPHKDQSAAVLARVTDFIARHASPAVRQA